MSRKNIEEMFRIALNTCDRCATQCRTIGTVRIEKQIKSWCANCMLLTYLERTPMNISTSFCDRCDKKIVQSYGVFWMHRNQRWCEECVIEVEKIQRSKNNVSD